MKSIFKTDRRIKLGIWGLGRGLSFYNSLRALNFDIVAGCDFNPHMRDRFAEMNPGALTTDDAERCTTWPKTIPSPPPTCGWPANGRKVFLAT